MDSQFYLRRQVYISLLSTRAETRPSTLGDKGQIDSGRQGSDPWLPWIRVALRDPLKSIDCLEFHDFHGFRRFFCEYHAFQGIPQKSMKTHDVHGKPCYLWKSWKSMDWLKTNGVHGFHKFSGIPMKSMETQGMDRISWKPGNSRITPQVSWKPTVPMHFWQNRENVRNWWISNSTSVDKCRFHSCRHGLKRARQRLSTRVKLILGDKGQIRGFHGSAWLSGIRRNPWVV